MNRRPMILALASALAISACGGDEEARQQTNANPLLELVPADTPYVIANLQPVPEAVVDAHIERMTPFLQQMQGQLESAQRELETAKGSDDDEELALMDAVFNEFDGKLNRQGLESMGLALEAMSVMYGHGLFPVLRAGIGDAEKVRAMVARIEQQSGQSIPETDFRGTSFWRMADDETPMGLYLAILEDHIVMSAAPVSREAEFLPQLLGLERPTDSLATSGALAELNSEKGFSPYGSGFIEHGRIIDELFETDSVTAQWMGDMGQFDLSAVDPACEREARLISTFAPRMVMGTTDITEDTVAIRYQLETNPLLGGQLAGLVADVPPASADSAKLASFSLSLEMGRVREFLLDASTAMAAVPFQCPQLQDMNAGVAQMAEALSQPMPPFLGNLKGMRAELNDVDPSDPQPETMRGLLSLEMESPQMVIGMASMMIPGFEDLNIEPGSDPVALPRDLMMVQTPDIELYAVMSNDAIGISIGEGQSALLRPFLDQDTAPDGVFLSADYDMAAIAELQGNAMEQMARGGVYPDDGNGADVNAAQLDELMDSYESIAGRSRLEMRFDGNGLTIDNIQHFR